METHAAAHLAPIASVPVLFTASFGGAGCAGNCHAVVINPHKQEIQEWLSLSEKIAPFILVILQKPRQSEIADAQFFHHGRSVIWCGSGVLAAAKALQHAGHRVRSIATGGTCFELLFHQGKIGFASSPTFKWRPVRNTCFWRHLFGRTLITALESPHRAGYTLLELNHEHAVQNWRPRLQTLRRGSQRALILTAKAQSRDDYVMRYFAPQYGNDEDSATGSANALLIPYWAKRLNKRWLKGRQLSADGGRFYGHPQAGGGAALYGETRVLGEIGE